MRQRSASSCSAEDERACHFLVTQYGFGEPVRFGRNQLLAALMKKWSQVGRLLERSARRNRASCQHSRDSCS